MTEGIDYAYGWRPGFGAKIRAAGKEFVCRYLSGGGSKDLTAAERDDLLGAGLAIVLVWETDGRTGPLMGTRGGQLDGNAAVAQARQLGAPAGACLYFAVDFGATSGQLAALQAYFAAARAVCHAAGYRCGAYGGLLTVGGDQAEVDCAWQTYAWSGGQWSPAAHLQQYQNGQILGGVFVDFDRATTADYGQFGGTTDMTPQQAQALASWGIRTFQHMGAYLGGGAETNATADLAAAILSGDVATAIAIADGAGYPAEPDLSAITAITAQMKTALEQIQQQQVTDEQAAAVVAQDVQRLNDQATPPNPPIDHQGGPA